MAAKNFVSNKDESVRLFQSDALERLTHMHWSTPLVLFAPVVAYFVYQAAAVFRLGPAASAGLFAAGLLVWTFTEYSLHRFVFHYQPSSRFGQRLHFLMHGVHHDYPSDSKRLVMAPAVSIPLASAFYGLFVVLMGAASAAPFFSGFIFGYICYDLIHYATHHAPMRNRAWLWLKHHHMKHHFQAPDLGYGVSSPLWDYVFGTTFTGKQDRTSPESET